MQFTLASHAYIGLLSLALCPLLTAQTMTTRVSISSAGVQGDGDSSNPANTPAISADARYVAFTSAASNLVSNDTNGKLDVYVRDRQTGATTRVSVGSGGEQGNELSHYPSISSDGRYVAFSSEAGSLIASDTNNIEDVFVRDLISGTTTRVSVASSGAQGSGMFGSWETSISADGRLVAFGSYCTNLVPADTNNKADVFVHDRQTGVTTRVSVDSAGAEALGGNSLNPALSADGRYVAFESEATNLVALDTNSAVDVFVHDRQTGATVRASVDSFGAEGNLGCTYPPALSADGRYVVFASAATNLVLGDSNLSDDVFVRDLVLGATERVSLDSNGAESIGNSLGVSISSDGRYVAFTSEAPTLVPGDTNGKADVFVRDRQLAVTTRVSVDSAGMQGGAASYNSSMSGNGRFVAFGSASTHLVLNDTNSKRDVFVHDRGTPITAVFCTAGTTSHGCVPAISSTGTPSASAANGFTLNVSFVEGQVQGMLFYGINNTGYTPLPWGPSSSYLCVKSPSQRMGVQSSGGASNACNGALAKDWNAFIAASPAALGNPFAAGQQVFAQGWFRDPASPKTTMLSDALEFVVQP